MTSLDIPEPVLRYAQGLGYCFKIHPSAFPRFSEASGHGLEANGIFDIQSIAAGKLPQDWAHDFPEPARDQTDLIFREDLSHKVLGFLRWGGILHCLT